ncbi:pentatricopeptide repeat-containing protein At1g06710, mitochondrial isoform X1 [Salvia hispanica]|uniref:pentatricopeptide repeat-containing protein At1g06710, mitochondrial isoform X1 n=1 Tax=Salvia hispanica TaxID=49212 RepID=UPI002009D635|nr:pentatricopeptide repeat-containing protein At1g06710, mitochondrial isoform X1 [Salvia hispanica]XP_047982458.1 pentatricopeptide repeat-containing protein At1g06710, mitochondrial isoform X1 [Salvia hispanica]
MSRRVLNSSLLSSAKFFNSLKPFYRFFSTDEIFLQGLTAADGNLDGLFTDDEALYSAPQDAPAQYLSFLKESIFDAKAEVFESVKCSTDAISIINTIKSSNDGLGEESQKFLRQFRAKLDGNLVVDVLRNVQNPELGVRFFMWAGRQIGYSHNVTVYEALLELLGGGRDERVNDHFLLEIKGDDGEVLGRLLNVLIRKCCHGGMWNLALEELGRLKDFGYKPSRATYNALVRVFLEAGKVDTALLLHREMLSLGFKMESHILGSFVHFLCKIGKWRDALTMIETEEVQPDTLLYTKMIMGLCEGSFFEEAMEFLHRMRVDSCVPNVVTYRVLLCGCLNKGKLGRCKRVLSMMIAEGCYPSTRIFCSLVHAYCKSGDHSYAYKLFKKMVECGCKPGYVVYNILIGSICGGDSLPSPDMLELAEKAYSEMLVSKLALNRVNVSNFSRCLCGAGKYEKAYRVIHEMMGNGFVPEAGTYNKVIGFFCDASKVDKALLLFKEMKENGVVPNVYTYSIMIDRFCKAGLIQQARCWFEEMMRDGCPPTVVTYTALIHAYLKVRKISDANEIFEMMLTQGCQPNVITFTALIDGYCKAGQIEKAGAIYERMRGNLDVHDVDMYFRISDNSNNEPNVVTHGALIDGLCKVHRVKEANKILDAMMAQNCEPNAVVYDALIDGFCKVGKLDEAQEVFAKMSERGYTPNVYTYSSLIDRLFKEKRLDLALKVLAKMLENSCMPNVITYTEMVDGLCKNGKTAEAYKLMLMMEEKGCNPNVVTYTAMIDGFGVTGRVDKCLELFQEMTKKGCAPNYVTYRVLIKHCCGVGRLDEAYQLLEEMKQTYWPSRLANYQKVVEGFSKDFMLSHELVNEMGNDDAVPLIPAYKVLIDSFRKAGRLEMALQLHREFSSLSPCSSMQKNVCSSLIESLTASGKIDEAFELYADMIGKGNVPEFAVIVDLVKGLLKVNRWGDALILSESLCHMDIQWLTNQNTQKQT